MPVVDEGLLGIQVGEEELVGPVLVLHDLGVHEEQDLLLEQRVAVKLLKV